VTARLLLAPLLAGLGGRDPREAWAWRALALGAPMGAEGDRETFHRARLGLEGVSALDDQDSSAQRALAAADTLIRRRPGETAASVGDLVECLDF
jgi:molybdopterin molybdotransferase